MATIYPDTPAITGVTATVCTLLTTSTLTIMATTAQGVLDTNKLVVIFQAASSVLSSIEFVAGANYSKHDVVLPSALAIPTTESAIVVGGTYFESTRFQNASDAICFYNTGASVLVTCYMLP
jgi:hypothetical protein